MYNPSTHLSNTLRRAADSGLTMPASLTAHWAEVAELGEDLTEAEAARPMDAAISAARSRKLTDKALTAAALRQFRIDAIDSAKGDAEGDFSSVLDGVKDELIETIKTEVYAPAIAKLEALAERVEADETIDDLVRRGRTDDATARYEAEAAAREIQRAHELTRDLDRGRSLKNLRTMYRNADAAKGAIHHGSEWSVSSILAAIKAGARPWLPPRDELHGVNLEIQAELEAGRAKSAGRYGDAPNFFAAH